MPERGPPFAFIAQIVRHASHSEVGGLPLGRDRRRARGDRQVGVSVIGRLGDVCT